MDAGVSTGRLAVSGSGPVGLLVAIGAIRLGFEVTLIEQAPPVTRNGSGTDDPRTTALSPTTRAALEDAGVWSELARHAEAIRGVHVSEAGGFGTARLDAAREGRHALGWVVPNAVLERVLKERLDAVANLRRVEPATIEAVADGPGPMVLTLSGTAAGTYSCDGLVVAEGAASATRARLGVETVSRESRHAALISRITLDREHGGVAHERFTDDGALALLPCGPRRSALVWSLPRERAARLEGVPAREFLPALHRAFGFRLGRLVDADSRACVPLRTHRVRTMLQGRTALVGNAAHALHPIAGQGFNLGVRDAVSFLEVLQEAGPPEQRPGVAWRRWERTRLEDLLRTATLTDGLLWAFRGRAAPLRLLRGLGLNALELCRPARRAFLSRATGEESRAVDPLKGRSHHEYESLSLADHRASLRDPQHGDPP